MTGNSTAKIDGDYRSAAITGKVVDLDVNEPPNPTANDTNDSFALPEIPIEADKTSVEWGLMHIGNLTESGIQTGNGKVTGFIFHIIVGYIPAMDGNMFM